MPRWKPSRIWDGQDVYIIGGGPSLQKFNWDILKDKRSVGCNQAFLHGYRICEICIFGDLTWWENFKDSLGFFKGLVVTNAPKLKESDCEWLLWMRRVSRGLDTEALAWNGNTGASAINLALILGAKRVFLLGFDMKKGNDGENNWHPYHKDDPGIDIYDGFLKGFEDVARDLPLKFSGCEIINVTNDSDLNLFPKVSPTEHFKKEGMEIWREQLQS